MEPITRWLTWRLNSGGWSFPPLCSAAPQGFLLREKQDSGGSTTFPEVFSRALEASLRSPAQQVSPHISLVRIGSRAHPASVAKEGCGTTWLAGGGGAPTVPTPPGTAASLPLRGVVRVKGSVPDIWDSGHVAILFDIARCGAHLPKPETIWWHGHRWETLRIY